MKISKLTVILIFIILGMGYMLFKDILPEQPKRAVVSDTVFIDKPFRVEEIKEVEKEVPRKVVEYKTDTVEVERIKVIKDTIQITTHDPRDIFYDTRYLTSYTSSPKFLELELNDEKLTFTGMSPDGSVREESFNIDSEYNRYDMRLDGSGWVGLEKQNYGFWRGLRRDRFNHEIAVGKYWDKPFPYAAYRAEIRIFGGLHLEGEARVSKRFRLGLEVKYEIGH